MLRAETLADRTPQGIAGEISRLVAEGVLAPGDRLPTVRRVAADLGVSAGTVGAAWRALAGAGVIVSRGRAGTFVREERRDWLSRRVHDLAGPGAPTRLDLSLGTPDPALLPSLSAAFSRVTPRADTGRYHDQPVLPELAEVLRETWPTSGVEAITVVDGALDGISRVLEQVVRFGDRVAIESPGFPYFFDLLDVLGAQAVPLELDREGVVPASLGAALARRPVAVLLQPRAQNPTGASMSAERARALVRVLRGVPGGDRVTVVEDDHSALIGSAPDVTLGRWLPAQVVHVRSFSKSHGPDLRIAAMGGPARLIERVVARRMLGPGWTSRLLQAVLVDLLTDPGAVARVRTARLVYRDRLDRLASGLRRRGIDVGDPDGINLWLPVADERAALAHLAASGMLAAAGTPFRIAEGGANLRVTAGAASANIPVIAEALADAAAAAPLVR
ncbi:aminotransferase class I/II-fold pyridoxal phosphate-dependent enzyme [Microbacterium sp. SORGH_AS_0888]|uniref:aminotransferase class I/II-fold pyridoxal phosphate-dependent enzyme n=1 Tax=Microbacterium sp. SORGH_AS_0888 TaxID=3041791 RepID=UPI002782755C|nr:aminotransferase class I/II-fold pyridoxal phosphate-dependent enzyme [Microbacterium sp. SORGH_AS_0888]MDQ1129396.1 DNA-binding transcriptional MocR family regulator [Microbacterium sp. SORGH_AS_0888]